ncbi:AmmeMemoRadiSam system radical SAM enzyme [Halorhodospira abdelmalekii]|uniref:AmmeMemoRadiSam system radical SAM enzyme n=1 Tax=Halorhodospira abdelmalekii TaxID=421629 RepID=UPI0019064EDA|nr:AmmeMemoRadiSam system radical SAM enzyme [Halorhodospira abdelmalekii]MBK1733905.1 AmmeMemoRadiSam system radical SAM enzyme [Halorhodospira abdelmalekii]
MRERDPHDPATVATRYWQRLDDGRLECQLCPRCCRLREGQRGLCFVRAARSGERGGEVVLTTYGRSSGLYLDPIEKKPLNHFLPGTAVLSLGTAGCNLFCKFCQNWELSKSRELARLAEPAEPEQIAEAAVRYGAHSVAYTYNDPVIFHEYAIDTAAACRARGIDSVAVTAGYICEEPRREFFAAMDAANIDLKAFSERFYRHLTGAQLAPVLETLEYVYYETDVWLELTTLLVPGENDSDREIAGMARWVAEHLGPQVPMHFTAFHPAFKMVQARATPIETLRRARQIAMAEGVRYVYIGNVHDRAASSTYCHHCGALLIERIGYTLGAWQLDSAGRCAQCATPCAGVFAARGPHVLCQNGEQIDVQNPSGFTPREW